MAKTIAAPLLATLLVLPMLAAADDGVPVPNREAPKASFTASEGAAHTFVARGEDRARMVAFEALLITASLGSKVELEAGPAGDDQPAVVELLEGGFHLVAGSTAVHLKLGDAVLRAVDTEVMAARLGSTWIVQVVPQGEEGRVELIPPAPAPAPATAEGETADPATDSDAEAAPAPAPAPEPVALVAGKRHTLKAGEPVKAQRRESDYLAKTIDRLLPETDAGSQPSKSAAAPQLTPRDIEDPRDFVVIGAGSDAALSDLEIEDVEVDLGCVEICVD